MLAGCARDREHIVESSTRRQRRPRRHRKALRRFQPRMLVAFNFGRTMRLACDAIRATFPCHQASNMPPMRQPDDPSTLHDERKGDPQYQRGEHAIRMTFLR